MNTKIDDDADIARGLDYLSEADPRLVPVIEKAGLVPLRRRDGGYEGLAEIVVSQQISKAAATAIWNRLVTRIEPLHPNGVLTLSEEDLRNCGLSRPKVRTLRAVAEATHDGFDFDDLAEKSVDQALEDLMALNGVGPWTAEVYLLVCLGHSDVFPAGDVALQSAVSRGLEMDYRPGAKELRDIAAIWSPWRGVAARLFWAYYAATQTDAMPVSDATDKDGKRLNG